MSETPSDLFDLFPRSRPVLERLALKSPVFRQLARQYRGINGSLGPGASGQGTRFVHLAKEHAESRRHLLDLIAALIRHESAQDQAPSQVQ